MSWRFRKTFKLLPGVKLNLTRHGLSATLGATPVSINVGPRGVYRNVSIPGTGIWDRQRIDIPSSQPSGIELPLVNEGRVSPGPRGSPSPASEIHSASTELLSSEGMEQLRRLIKDAYDERATLTSEISTAALEANTAKNSYQGWEHGFFMKRIRKASFGARKEAADTAVARLEELQEQLRLTTLATEIAVDREQADRYYRMRDEFAVLSGCQKIWNVLTEQVVDRFVERCTADTAITRDSVSFSLTSCDLIQWGQTVPRLPNRTGGDMYVYPGFILYRASKQAFALIDFRDVSLRVVPTRFTEAETVPSDTQVLGQTWAKSNKDGSPDRRFQANRQIPVVHYGLLLFTSPDGLDVRYLCSNAAIAERFIKAWAAFRTSFGGREGDEDQTVKALRNMDTAERFKIAHDKFSAAHLAFNKNLSGIAESGGQGAIGMEDFTAYMALVAELISAVRRCTELQGPSQSHTAGAKLCGAVETFEAARTHFEKVVYQGRMDAECIAIYYSAVGPFFDAVTQFWETLTGSGIRDEAKNKSGRNSRARPLK